MSWADERARFPVLERFAYLNAGTNGPLARRRSTRWPSCAAWEADARSRREGVLRSRCSSDAERVRALLAAAARASPTENVALTESTTQGVHVVVTGLALGPADEVVTTDAEHFGLTGPLVASDASLRIARVRDVPAEDVFELDARAR